MDFFEMNLLKKVRDGPESRSLSRLAGSKQ